MLMAAAADLIIVFLALELLSIPLYVMAGFAVPRSESEEASLKYFLLGAFSTGIFVYGTALVFGATATTSIKGIAGAVSAGSAIPGLLLIGALLLLAGATRELEGIARDEGMLGLGVIVAGVAAIWIFASSRTRADQMRFIEQHLAACVAGE